MPLAPLTGGISCELVTPIGLLRVGERLHEIDQEPKLPFRELMRRGRYRERGYRDESMGHHPAKLLGALGRLPRRRDVDAIRLLRRVATSGWLCRGLLLRVLVHQ